MQGPPLSLRAVLLDLGNVLWDDDPVDARTFAVLREFYRAHGLEISQEKMEAAVSEAVAAWVPSVNEYLIERFSQRAGLDRRQALAEWAVVFAPVQQEEIASVRLFPDVPPSLWRLHRAGLKLAVATNYGPVVRARLESLGVEHFIDVWGLAPELGSRKPEPAFFDEVIGRLACAPHEAVMIGDRLDNDIVPAKHHGMRTVRLIHGLHAAQRARGPDEQPDYTARSFSDAADWILQHTG